MCLHVLCINIQYMYRHPLTHIRHMVCMYSSTFELCTGLKHNAMKLTKKVMIC